MCGASHTGEIRGARAVDDPVVTLARVQRAAARQDVDDKRVAVRSRPANSAHANFEATRCLQRCKPLGNLSPSGLADWQQQPTRGNESYRAAIPLLLERKYRVHGVARRAEHEHERVSHFEV